MNKYNVNDEFYYLTIEKHDERNLSDLKVYVDKVKAISFEEADEGKTKITYIGKDSNILFDISAMWDTKQMAVNQVIKYLQEDI